MSYVHGLRTSDRKAHGIQTMPWLPAGTQEPTAYKPCRGYQLFTTVAPTTLEQTAVGGAFSVGVQTIGRVANYAAPFQLVYDSGVYLGALVVCSQD